jgi:transcriptional regulator with XRE-family HTH domain
MARSGFGKRFPTRNSAVSRTLAANVRRLRKERGWTQDDLAAVTKLEQAAISLIENNRANPTIMMIENIARGLGVHFIELFGSPARRRRAREK